MRTDELVTSNVSASGDIGNVSQIVPTIQPGYSITTTAVNHTRAFTEAAGKCCREHSGFPPDVTFLLIFLSKRYLSYLMLTLLLFLHLYFL